MEQIKYFIVTEQGEVLEVTGQRIGGRIQLRALSPSTTKLAQRGLLYAMPGKPKTAFALCKGYGLTREAAIQNACQKRSA